MPPGGDKSPRRESAPPRIRLDTPATDIDLGAKVTVKFKLDEFHIIAQVYTTEMRLAEVIADLARKFKLDTKYLRLTHDDLADSELVDSMRLAELPHNEFRIIEMGLELTPAADVFNCAVRRKSEMVRLDPEVFYSHYHLPVFFSVQIPEDCNKMTVEKQLIVEIVSQPIVKSFVGGWKNTKTGIEYHDAFTQTGPGLEAIKWDGIISRPTQTIELKETTDDTHYDRCNQAFGSATELIYVPSVSDYTLVPGKYETYHEKCVRLNKLGKIRLIQRNFRRYRLWKFIREAAAEYRGLVAEQDRRQDLRKERLLDCFKRECIKKSFPKTREDFNMLNVQIHKWKESEVKRITEIAFGGPRIALLASLLEREVELLNGVERKYLAVQRHVIAQRAENKLDKMGQPIRWVGYKNILCEMDSLRTQRIRYLVGVYRDMKMSRDPVERIAWIDGVYDILANEEPTKNRNELIELLKREQNLLRCNLSSETVKTLRMRQMNLMVEIINTYDQPLKTMKVSNVKLLCKQCKKSRPAGDFQLNTRQKETNVCTACTLLKDPPTDFTIYRQLLRSIQRDERRRGALASYAFIVQENDIRELIDTIWHGHSIFSQNSIHTELALPRWRRGDDWSPWNCVCLTEEEARSHVKLFHLEDLYDDYLIEKVELKNSLARLAFKKLFSVNLELVDSNEWWQTGLKDGTV